MANAKTRLAEAYTCVSPCTTNLTDAGFSYSPRGEINDVYQSTPHSGGYYHVNALYWESGALKQFSGLPSLPTISYAPDAQGRPNTVTASSGQNPVTSTTYSPYAAPQLTVNLGSGDSDVFTADTSTGRLTQYKFKIGATQSLTGNLTWNANGSLQQQAITDNFNSTNTQTCNYAYDDISRLASGNCGSAASQTFSYDPFGNINKSGSPFSFQPTYSYATNRMTLLPGNFTPTYDNNGNVLNDSAHQYTPDAENRPMTTDGVALTFDALGRMVEQNRSSVYTQIVYGPGGGKLALMSGQTLQKAFVALPGGAQAVYNSSGLLYYGHSDHLGSARLGSTTTRTFSCDLAYAPFGEPYAQFGTPDLSFTGQRQDTSSGLYDFLAREYSSQGRWPSPDPTGLTAVSLSNPQTWNRYAYVGNNPLSRTDPLGEFFVDCSWGGCPGSACPYCGGGGAEGGGGYYGGGGSPCTLDGIDVPCGSLSGLGSNGIAPCPNNFCHGSVNGVYEQFTADANGAGFYSCLAAGPFDTQQQAGIAAATCAAGPSIYYHREYYGNIYQVDSNGKYSFTTPEQGYATSSWYDATDIPDDTEYAGYYHTHPAPPPGYTSEQPSPLDLGIVYSKQNGLFPDYIGTVGGRILMLDPFQFPPMPNGCVLVGPKVPVGLGISTVAIPICPY